MNNPYSNVYSEFHPKLGLDDHKMPRDSVGAEYGPIRLGDDQALLFLANPAGREI